MIVPRSDLLLRAGTTVGFENTLDFVQVVLNRQLNETSQEKRRVTYAVAVGTCALPRCTAESATQFSSKRSIVWNQARPGADYSVSDPHDILASAAGA